MLLKGKKILVGISGGIAAYKTLLLIRLLKKQGALVKCVCTPSALEFVTALSLETLSENPVYSDVFSPKNEYSTAHISYSDWADLLLVAPLSGNTLAKFAHGIADNALTSLFLAFNKPVLLVPAMNTRMWHHPATQENLGKLRSWGMTVLSPESGFLACGTEGDGRMPEPESILSAVIQLFGKQSHSKFMGKKVLVTAGPTVEALDPVRYISNHSSGKMGFCISDELGRRGADVYMVCGPVSVRPKMEPFRLIRVNSAQEMFEASTELWPEMDVAILSAAVADYAPASVSETKIKKKDGEMSVLLKKNPDILATLGQTKAVNQILVGFALETDHELENAKGKLQGKNADMIVLNSLRNPGAGFATDTNQVTFISRDGKVEEKSLRGKEEVAADLVDFLEENFS